MLAHTACLTDELVQAVLTNAPVSACINIHAVELLISIMSHCREYAPSRCSASIMQNRRIIDTNFRAAGVENSAAIGTNSLVTLWSHIRFGYWSTVVPNTFLLLLRQQEGVIALPLVAPESSHVLGLVVPDREPTPPLTRELLDVAKTLDLAARIKEHTARSWPPKSINPVRSG